MAAQYTQRNEMETAQDTASKPSSFESVQREQAIETIFGRYIGSLREKWGWAHRPLDGGTLEGIGIKSTPTEISIGKALGVKFPDRLSADPASQMQSGFDIINALDSCYRGVIAGNPEDIFHSTRAAEILLTEQQEAIRELEGSIRGLALEGAPEKLTSQRQELRELTTDLGNVTTNTAQRILRSHIAELETEIRRSPYLMGIRNLTTANQRLSDLTTAVHVLRKQLSGVPVETIT